jgi:hypothetical protein
MAFPGRPTASLVLCLSAAVLLAATGCNHPLFSKQAAAKPPAEKPDLSKLRPGTQCRVELSVVQNSGGPAHVAYTGTVSRVQGDEVTLVDAVRESGNEYGTPVAGSTPLANRMFKNRGVAADREKVGTISIPVAEISSVKPLDLDKEAKTASRQQVWQYNQMHSG